MNPTERLFANVQHYTEDGDETVIFGCVEYDLSLNSNEILILESDKALTEDDIRLHFENFKVSFL